MKIALAQVNATVGDLAGNARLITREIAAARSLGAEVVAFPELAVSGYPPEDLLLKDHFIAECRKSLLRIAEETFGIVAIVGVPLAEEGAVYNAAAVLSEGSLAGDYRKILLPNYAVFDEKRHFVAGTGLLILEGLDVRVAVNICEDIWDACGPAQAASEHGARLVINLSMSPYHFQKGSERKDMLARRAADAGAFLCYVNGVGGQDELLFDGQSMVFDDRGNLVARGCQFAEELLLVEVEVADDRPNKAADCTGAPRWPVEIVKLESPSRALSGDRRPGEAVVGESTLSVCSIVTESMGSEAEVYAALCLGVRDYVNKNGFERVVIGLSGGIDSALTACIAVDALGAERVNGVSMPSRYSSVGTQNDAQETAERLGMSFYEIPIEDVYRCYLDTLSSYFRAEAPGVTEQNIQARIRGNFLMALSNKFGWLVLTTGNKSEMAVGYATLYGDMAGGFAVLKDVPKTLVYRLANFRNSLGPQEGPIPHSTIVRPPSAELAPDQKDVDSLPPYDVLDPIIEAYVVHDQSVEEIVASGIPRRQVERVAAMIDGNEYKRRQAPPGVRITLKAFGKDRRLPITNRYRG